MARRPLPTPEQARSQATGAKGSGPGGQGQTARRDAVRPPQQRRGHVGAGTARIEDIGPVTFEQVKEWLGRCDVTVRPVLDLADRVAVDAYEVPDAMRETVLLRNPCCPCPWCDNLSRTKDLDHIVPFRPRDDGGPPRQTAAHLLAPLCRRHHRYETHGGWTYSMPEPGLYLWRSPRGRRYLVDHTGTRHLEPLDSVG